ncbi:MAG: hypothetical protein ACI9EF_000539 [Pseudohongiellaceae bacterium]
MNPAPASPAQLNPHAERRPAGRWLRNSGQLLALGSLALAQPLFDLLGRQPEFLAVRHLDGLDMLLFVGAAVALPCVLVLPLTALLRLVSPAGAQLLHGLAVAALTALILLPILGHLGLSPGWLALAVAVTLGLLFARDMHPGASRPASRSRWTFWTSWLPWVVVVVIVALFLGRPRVRAMVFGGSPGQVLGARQGDLPSVVMLVFDEFALVDILGADGFIEGETFPNFARLARVADWFPGHQTVADGTTHAVPAILTGRRLKDPDVLPILSDHPLNLFTLLAPTHELSVHESATSLTPQVSEGGRARAARQLALALDASVLWAKLTFPEELIGELPDVSSTWGGFVQLDDPGDTDDPSEKGEVAAWLAGVAHELGSDRAELFETLIDGLAADEPPTLHYLHVLLPHAPLQYLPQGAVYSVPVKGMIGGNWGTDSAAVGQAWQRHLMQLAFADRQLGRLLDRLEALQLFDETLLVVTADHGASFVEGGQPRALEPGNWADILPVPLFIKAPAQQQGALREGFAETIDILPTMLELLGLGSLSDPAAGHSLMGSLPQAPAERTVMTFANGGAELRVPGTIAGLAERVAQRQQVFPRLGQSGLFAVGPQRELLDRALHELTLGAATSLADLTDLGLLQSPFPRESTPRVVQGRWRGESAGDFLLAVNGVIRATTRSLAADKFGLQHFTLFVPEEVLQDEHNRLALFAVMSEPGAELVLHPVTAGPGAFAMGADGQWLVHPDGRRLSVSPEALRGRCRVVEAASGDVAVSGWAFDPQGAGAVEAVVVFAGQRFLLAVDANGVSPSLVPLFGEAAAQASYRATLQHERLQGAKLSELRVFAVSARGIASELQGASSTP